MFIVRLIVQIISSGKPHMEDDILATALDKLPPPPPMVQSRRPEPPLGGLGPAGPSTRSINEKERNPPTYAELLNQVDHSFQQPDYKEYPEPRSPSPPPCPPSPPPRPKKKTRRDELTYTSPPHAPIVPWYLKHKRALIVGCIVLLMLVYGIPKIQGFHTALSTPVPVYKLSHLGAVVVAALSAGAYAVATTYVI
jgi:hypothetical protein